MDLVEELTPNVDTSALRILVVDDDCDSRESMKEVLETGGYSVECARNGQDALAYLWNNPAPAAILVDLFMPLVNGWQLVQQLRANPTLAQIPIITVTGQGPHWGYPSERVLRKPFDARELLRAVRTATGNAGIAA